jgi:nitroreductase
MTETITELYNQRFAQDVDAEPEVALENEVVKTILSHRTHRRFLPDPVPGELMETLLACAYSAPSKSDLQQATVLRIIDEDKREAIASLIPGMPWIGSAPEFMVFCGDSSRIRSICERRGKPFANDHLDAFFNATVDSAIVMQNLIIAAESSGLGCCPISVIRNHASRVSEILELPMWVFPVAALCVGYPSAKAHISVRLPLALTVHVDTYDQAALDRELDGYDRRRDARYSIPDEKQKYVEDYGIAEFYGWSEDKARQVSCPERDDFGEFVRGQGFVLD